jgi:hypothetical protein
MERITESSKLAVRGSWAAWNHALAVEIEKRAIRQSLAHSPNESGWPKWFSHEFDTKVLEVAFDPQTEVKSIIDELFGLPWIGCHFAAWRYLHDIINAALPSLADSALESRRQRLLDEVEGKWYVLANHWNAQPQKFKQEMNERYKGLLESFIIKDFSRYRVGEEEEAYLIDLNVQVCDEVVKAIRIHFDNRKLRPVHLYTMLKILERHGYAPKRKRAVSAVFLGERYGVKVSKSYKPDPSRHRFAESDYEEPASDYARTVEATREALVGLNLIPKDYAFRK